MPWSPRRAAADTARRRICAAWCPQAQSVFKRSMPSDLIRGWKPVRVKKMRQSKEIEPLRFWFHQNRRGSSHHTASADLGEIAVDKGFLHSFHLAPIDAFCQGVVAVRQELRLDRLRQFNWTRRAQVGGGLGRLPRVAEQI